MEEINYIKQEMKQYKINNSLVIIPKEVKPQYEIIHICENNILKLNYNINLINKNLSKHIDKYIENINNLIEFIILKNKDDLLSNISHEINTILNSITNTVELLENKNNNKTVEIIYKNCLKLNLQFKNLINYFHLKTKKINMKLENKNTEEIIKYIKTYFKEEFKTISFKSSINVKTINIDKKKILECLIILIDNSIKFKSDLIYLNINKKEDKLFFTLLDNGIGVKNLKKIFEPFYKENDYSQGLGLGLTNFKSIIKKMNGNIKDINSNIINNKGLSITFYVKDNIVINKNEDTIENVKNLLIIEDNIINSKLLKIMLEKMDKKYKINIINDSRLVENHLKSNNYDLIFLDLKMPHINGFEILKKIDSKYKNKIIIITALLDENKVSELIDNILVKKIIYKPIKLIDLKIP